ncbi:uncharacterized protein MONOS_10738 [Monocercomonoides exilis]|uniref:uncharacterized protein n=1 Tax=Monocercomonoides exilis TaxID=2049356 RepID=UPI003559F71B|nr:hypothetical protein MONOS_10738 [Monocercomonoides exilis]|eukprot:MONOS_10738.1-p1 / transcript=MONOS_10738.1 / gene=MONOS_10738 / organism=Monocercomonoides_exilis_PA203 / gene_product=unspecified product / transcript_product=unspecified product / location=Mono_scaffold00499:41641-43105(+) / protein_length=435 / sequence_SO=supercontig / SO=protein_coding / is_pseudo=false
MVNGEVLQWKKVRMFYETLSQLNSCNAVEQAMKIEDVKGMLFKMNENELFSILSKDAFNELCKMMVEEKISVENAVMLLRHMGYRKSLSESWTKCFNRSMLCKYVERMIVEEEEGKDEWKKNLAIGLCECFLFLFDWRRCMPKKVLHKSVTLLLNFASNKEEIVNCQKDVEMALLALSCIAFNEDVKAELYLNKIIEIIKYHQENWNLTRLAYQSIWKFFIDRLFKEGKLASVAVNELHFFEESSRELEELERSVGKKKREKQGEVEAEEVWIIKKWCRTLETYFRYCPMWSKERTEPLSSIVKLCRASKKYCSEISIECECSLKRVICASGYTPDKRLPRSGVIEYALEELCLLPVKYDMISPFVMFILKLSEGQITPASDPGNKSCKKKIEKEIAEKLEEEGYEDVIVLFYILKRSADIFSDRSLENFFFKR